MKNIVILLFFILISTKSYADLTNDYITGEVIEVVNDNSKQLQEISIESVDNRKELYVFKFFTEHQNTTEMEEFRIASQVGNVVTVNLNCVFSRIDGKAHITKMKRYDVRTIYLIKDSLEFCYIQDTVVTY